MTNKISISTVTTSNDSKSQMDTTPTPPSLPDERARDHGRVIMRPGWRMEAGRPGHLDRTWRGPGQGDGLMSQPNSLAFNGQLSE